MSGRNPHSQADRQFVATYKVQNIVVNCNLFTEIDLEELSETYRDVELNLNRFPGICLRLSRPKAAILLFSNGKMVMTGLRESKFVEIVLEKVLQKLRNLGIQFQQPPEKKIVNIVASGSLGNPVNLDLSSILLERAMYEPEVFPGLIYRLEDPVKCVALMFSSGRIVITGVKREEDIQEVILKIGRNLKEKGLFRLPGEEDEYLL